MAPRSQSRGYAQLEPRGGYSGLCPPGMRQSGSHGVDERMFGYRGQLAYVSQNAINDTPIFAMSGALKKQKPIDDPDYRWHEKAYNSHSLKIEMAYGDDGGMPGTIGVIIASGSTWMLHEGVQLKNHVTGEIMRVVCAPSFIDPKGVQPVQIQVARGFAGTMPVAFDPNDPMIQNLCGEVCLDMIGTAFAEGSCNPSSIHRNPEMHNNYTQIFRKGHSITGTAKATKMRFGSKFASDKMEIAELFHKDVEKALLFSQMSIGSEQGKIFRTTDGLVSQIRKRAPENFIVRSNPMAPIGYTELEELLSRLFLYGSKEKMGFAGPVTMRTLRQLARMESDKIEYSADSKVLGRLMVTTFRIMGYVIHIHEHPMFRDSGYPWTSSLMVVDMDDMEFLALRGRDVKYRNFTSVETNDCGLDGDAAGWIAELMAVLISAQRHGVIQGLCIAGEDCFECAVPSEIETPESCPPVDPCLDPVELPPVNDAYGCETCGDSSGCSCSGKGPSSDIEPLTNNSETVPALIAAAAECGEDGQSTSDLDVDGIFDSEDDDIDGDGVINADDPNPLNANVTGLAGDAGEEGGKAP